ncbi:MAG: CerR family C-terminal domain-containing protein [Desulfomonilaceae bacterium]
MSSSALYPRNRTRHSAEDARQSLIYAGLDLFGKFSFEGTSTRMLAEQTKVNLAAIQYYFGGKGGLYLAVANHIVEQVNKSLGPKISEIQEILKQGPPSKQKSLCLLCQLVDLVVTRFVGIPETDKWLGILIREQLCPTEAFDILFKGFLKPFYQTLFGLVTCIQGSESDDPEVKIRAFTIMGQILIFRMSLAAIKQSLNLKDYGPKDLDMIRRVILDNVQAIFSVPAISSLTREIADNEQ